MWWLLQLFLVIIVCVLFFIIVFAAFWVTLDCDLTLWCAEKFGKSPQILKSKTVWITGASSGIGEELAFKLAAVGCKLILSGRDVSKLDNTKATCISLGAKEENILTLPFDLLDVDAHQIQLDKVLAKFERVDILVNNAGRSQRAQFHETSLKIDHEMFDVNVFSQVNLSRLLVNHWYTNDQPGHLVVTSSITGKFGVPNSPTYCATKHALHGYFESLRYEAHGKQVQITMICPGPVFSNLVERAFTGKPGETYGLVHGNEMKRMPTARCAQLMAVAMANKLNEAWICFHPILSLYFANQYMPALSKNILPNYLSIDRVTKYREGGNIANGAQNV